MPTSFENADTVDLIDRITNLAENSTFCIRNVSEIAYLWLQSHP